MKTMKTIFAKIEDIVINLCAICLAAIIFVIVYQVIARRLDIAVSGTEELARYAYVLFVFLLWPIAARNGQDLRITMIFDLLGPRPRDIIMGVFHIIMAGFSGLCTYSIYLNIQNAVKNGTTLSSNTWMPLAVILVCVAVGLVLTVLANILRAVLLFIGDEHVRTQQEENEAEMAAESAKIAAELAGYLPEGEGWKYICEGRTAYDGDKPINTNGGRTSFGHAHAASGMADLYEAVKQMRGEAGAGQVKFTPKTTMLRGYGGAQNICTYIIRTKD